MVAQHGIKDNQQFAHAGDQRELLGFAIEATSTKVSLVITDEAQGYDALEIYRPHEKIYHRGGEYVRGEVQTQNIESFNSRLRDECLNEHVFLNLAEAREIIEAWRHDYNHLRPHGSLGALTPTEFAMLKGQEMQPPQEGHNNDRLYL